ncbi:Fatty-acid amide hydrolase 2 [Strongyloides ratti]|uniref:Fatty-acid amide hydrolase 2 n=1 Tax=Strongyloides ratti TaxID=34506 RepID=A0A090MSI5_STRRB|nr:Fatty-acid amide hydrolase 2 [Strongyloides ratti]CEF61203.1 Fatty-acid amide hydrolase 2 [Strongyloides ratti]
MTLLYHLIDTEYLYSTPKFIVLFLKVIHVLFCIFINILFKIYWSLKKKQVVPNIKNDLLKLPAIKCGELIRQRLLTSTELVGSYIERQLEVNPIINGIMEKSYHKALKTANDIDNYLKHIDVNSEEYSILMEEKPLLGVPFTVANSIVVKNFQSTCGIVQRKLFQKSGTIENQGVNRLIEAGAIPIASSNVSQLCMWIECNNKVIGRTNNPYDDRRTSGGSSGGEAALIASGGSLFGIGSNIIGSITIPASFCGIYAYKPTSEIFLCDGHIPEITHSMTSLACISVMSRFANDLYSISKIFYDNNDLIPKTISINIKELKYFYLEDLNYMQAEPIHYNCRYAINKVTDALFFNYGITSIKVEFEELRSAYEMWQATLQVVTNKNMHDIYGLLTNFHPTRIVNNIREVNANILGFKSEYDLGMLLEKTTLTLLRSLCKTKIQKYLSMKKNLCKKIENLLGDNGILIAPAFAVPAPYHNQQMFTRIDHIYGSIFCALGFPVITCPVYHNSSGIPINVQIIAKKNNDKILFPLAEKLEKTLGGWREAKT